MLDYLFYLKHSNLRAHRRATAGYTCVQLYGMVNEFRLHALVTEELEQDCRSCGRCRFLLASCSRHDDHSESTHSSSSSSKSERSSHEPPSESESDSDAANKCGAEAGDAQADCACASSAAAAAREVIIID